MNDYLEVQRDPELARFSINNLVFMLSFARRTWITQLLSYDEQSPTKDNHLEKARLLYEQIEFLRTEIMSRSIKERSDYFYSNLTEADYYGTQGMNEEAQTIHRSLLSFLEEFPFLSEKELRALSSN